MQYLSLFFFLEILVVVLYSEQRDFPLFKNPLNQLDFETKRIYIDIIKTYESPEKLKNAYENYLLGSSNNNIKNKSIRANLMLTSTSLSNDDLITRQETALERKDYSKIFAHKELYYGKWGKYPYISSMVMTRNNKIIAETDLLRIIGSNNEAESLENMYNEQLEYWKNNRFTIKEVPNGSLSLASVVLWGWAQFCFMGELTNFLAGNDPMLGPFLQRMGHGIPQYLGSYALAKLAVGPLSNKIELERPKPNYIQQYSNQQLIAIVDSYNNYIYNEIKSWDESDIK